MAPKPAPKLTKKQLDELKKEEARKREAEEKQRREEEEERAREKLRLDSIEREKQREEQRQRIAREKELYLGTVANRLKEEERALTKLKEDEEWRKTTTEYFKSYNTSPPQLSTFIHTFKDEVYGTPEKILRACEEAERYVKHIGEKLLSCRSEGKIEEEVVYRAAIEMIRSIEMNKVERIMIDMANSAEQMEEKNSELSKKGEPNRKIDGQKILEYQHFMSSNIKIGMFLNSSTTKNLNKFRPIEIKEFGLSSEIPSKWMNASTIVRFQWVNFNPFSPATHERFLIIGGVYNLQFYELLLGTKRINNIMLKKHYKDNEILDKFKMQTAMIKEPFNVMYQIPKYVFLRCFEQTTLKFAQYDVANSKWVMLPNDTVVQYEPNQKKAICRIYKPEPIAYVQDRCTDYPYIAWELRCVERGKAKLDIQLRRALPKKTETGDLQRLMLQFQIAENTVKLVTSEHYPQLSDLCEQPRVAQLLLYELSERGVHLLPVDQDYSQAKLPPKDKEAEQNAIRDIAYAVDSFYIRSEINDSTEVTVKIRENLEYESVFLEDQEKDWKRIRWSGPDRCWVSNRNVRERHLNLDVLLSSHDICDKECVERMKFDRNFLFKRNVMKMLALTRVLGFITNINQQSLLRWTLKQRTIVK